MQTNKIGEMPFRDEEKKFSRNADHLVKHTFNTFDFYTDSTDEPSDRLKAVAVTLRDDGYHIEDEPCVIIEIGKCVAVEHDTYNFDIWQTVNSYKSFEHSDREYTVMTDSEADKAWDESLDSYLDECVLSDLPDTARNYFDNEKWKDDARMDGRGHSLNHYDGGEEEANINDVDYYIYRRN